MCKNVIASEIFTALAHQLRILPRNELYSPRIFDVVTTLTAIPDDPITPFEISRLSFVIYEVARSGVPTCVPKIPRRRTVSTFN